MQERRETDQNDYFIEHKSDSHFVVNLGAFHNAHLLRRALPRSLTAPVHLFPDRKTKHDELAQKLRGAQCLKRAEIQKKKEARTATKRKASEMEEEPEAGTTSCSR